MARARWWKDRRAWIESDAKKRAQEYADMIRWWQRLLCWLSKRYKARWEKAKSKRYTRALKFFTNRLSHGVYRRPPEEIRAEKKMRRMAERKRKDEIAKGERFSVKLGYTPKVTP